MDEKIKMLNNELLQDTVFLPFLFNLYICNLLNTIVRKTILANDPAFSYQNQNFIKIELHLT